MSDTTTTAFEPHADIWRALRHLRQATAKVKQDAAWDALEAALRDALAQPQLPPPLIAPVTTVMTIDAEAMKQRCIAAVTNAACGNLQNIGSSFQLGMMDFQERALRELQKLNTLPDVKDEWGEYR
jgi:hypothetical protein